MRSQITATPFGSLKILNKNSHFFDIPVIDSLSYSHFIAKDTYSVCIGIPEKGKINTYRKRMLAKGIYVGHHLGNSGTVTVSRRSLEFSLDSGDPSEERSFFWNYAIKIYCATSSIYSSALSLKATTLLDDKGSVILLIGRGASGKSRMAFELSKFGYSVIGNTHALVMNGEAWALNTWARSRESGQETYLNPARPSLIGNGPIKKIVIVDHNKRGELIVRNIKKTDAYAFMTQFSWATGAYDLKEDIYDQLSGVQEFSSIIAHELKMIKSLVYQFPILHISADVSIESVLQRLASILWR